MVRAELDGKHAYETDVGINVQIWKRSGKYIARGRLNGRQFGESLGEDPKAASSALRRLLTQLEERTYLPPSDLVRRLRKKREQTIIPRITLPDLFDRHIADVMRRRGKKTAERYENWLAHVRAYLDQQIAASKCCLAIDVTENMVRDLKKFLSSRQVARNGRANGKLAFMSVKGVRDVLERLRAVFKFAKKEHLLPAEFDNPVTPEIIGPKPKADQLRPIPYTLADRIAMVMCADEYQLIHVVPRFVLPVRPEELTGLLIHEVDVAGGFLRFGTRFEGRDWTKGKTSFSVPFQPEILTLIVAAIAGRADGPVFRARRFFEGSRKTKIIVTERGDMATAVERALMKAAPTIEGPGDTKPIVRKTIAAAGGVTTDALRGEFNKLREKAGLVNNARFYDLRSSVLTDMADADVPTRFVKYVAGHTPDGMLETHYLKSGIEGLKKKLQPYWEYVRPLLDAIQQRAEQLGLASATTEEDSHVA